MLRSRNLDDQTFADIMEYALGRLPWLCPAWTDHNAHDPGITILELMAWYKEMQQYHMNVVTEELKQKFLKLLGVVPAPAQPAACLVRPSWEEGQEYPLLTRLENGEGICFELQEPAKAGGQVTAIYLNGPQGAQDMTGIMGQPGITIWPFLSRKGGGQLIIGISGEERVMRLWFQVDDKRPVDRNPFAPGQAAPRTLAWRCSGLDALPQVQDETHGLSHSGFITFTFPEGFGESDGGCGLPLRRYLTVEETCHGCEEDVRLSQVSAGWFRCRQQETWARYSWYRIGPEETTLLLQDGVSQAGGVYLFLREEAGLRVAEWAQRPTADGLAVTVQGAGSVQDGQDNLLVVSQDALRYNRLLYPSTGLPNMAVELDLGGRQVLPETLALVCDTRCQDGQVRPRLWRYVTDLSACGPRDLAFTFDPAGEQLLFGDGAHGAVPPRGEQGIMIASMALSYCSGGNVPENCGLTFADGSPGDNRAAVGGREAQSLQDAATAFLRSMEDTYKCVSQADYERLALATPGLRVAQAKAIAGFDPDEPTGHSRIPVVTVVVRPWSAQERPMPDAAFMAAIQAQLERYRPVCTSVKVVPPQYVPVGISLQVRGRGPGLEAAIRKQVEAYLETGRQGRAIGDPVVKDDLMAELMSLDGVMQVERLELRALRPDCYEDPRGDLRLKQNAIAYLGSLDLQTR